MARITTLSNNTILKLYEFALKAPGPKTWWITRLSMYKALQNKFLELDNGDKKCLAISSTSPNLGKDILGLHNTLFTYANYPEYNMTDLRFENDSFDFCISDQVLEHIEGDPFKAFAETARVIRGGYICHTTCFVNEVHGAPKDFWRFTPEALALMAKQAGLDPTLTGGWGNREVVDILQDQKLRYAKIPDDPQNPIYQLAVKNEPDWPICVWIIARKP